MCTHLHGSYCYFTFIQFYNNLQQGYRTHLLGLHLEAAADGVERVRGVARRDSDGLRNAELGEEPLGALVVLVGVFLASRVVEAEVDTAVPDITVRGGGG